MLKHVVTPYMLIGGSVLLSYQLILDYLRHHEESNNDRPQYFDHLFASTIIGSTAGFFLGGAPRFVFIGAFVTSFILSPMLWWMKTHARMNA